MAIVLKLRDAAFKAHIRKATAAGLQRAGVFLHSACVRAVNKSNTHRYVKKFSARESANRGGQKTGVTYSNMHNAYAGQPPFKRTGVGQSNICYEFNGDEKNPAVRVGVRKNAMYMLFLELGTGRILARPWLLETLKRNKAVLGRLCCMGGEKK
jgi:hypothetical protein